MKLFAIFGIICFIDPQLGDKVCMNFWEEPVVKTPLEECIDNGQKKYIEVKQKFMEEGIYISNIEMYCIPVK